MNQTTNWCRRGENMRAIEPDLENRVIEAGLGVRMTSASLWNTLERMNPLHGRVVQIRRLNAWGRTGLRSALFINKDTAGQILALLGAVLPSGECPVGQGLFTHGTADNLLSKEG
jgi:hypothetical protein